MEPKSKLPSYAIDITEDPQATGYPDSRKLVRDQAGNLYAAYRKKGADQAYHIFVAILPQGSQHWQSPVQIEQVGAFHQRVPALALDQNDTLHVAWYGLYTGCQGQHDRQIYYSRGRWLPNGQWRWDEPRLPAGVIAGYAAVQPEPTLWQEHPVIYAAPDGALYIVWEGKDDLEGKKARIKLICSLDGGSSWTAWRNLPSTSGVHYSRPTLVTSRDGKTLYCLAYATGPNRQARLVWTQINSPRDLWADGWRPWGEVAPADSQDQRSVSVVIDGADHLHAVWQQKSTENPSSAQISYTVFANGAWDRPIYPVANPAIFQGFPSLTIDASGQLWLAWNEFRHEPKFHGDKIPHGLIGVACKPPGAQWQVLDTARLIPTQTGFYPSLRWPLRPNDAAVDLIWLETGSAIEQFNALVPPTKSSSRRYVISHASLTHNP